MINISSDKFKSRNRDIKRRRLIIGVGGSKFHTEFHISRKEAKSARNQLNRFDLDGRLVSVKTHRQIVNRLRKAFDIVTANCTSMAACGLPSLLSFQCSNKDEFDKAAKLLEAGI